MPKTAQLNSVSPPESSKALQIRLYHFGPSVPKLEGFHWTALRWPLPHIVELPFLRPSNDQTATLKMPSGIFLLALLDYVSRAHEIEIRPSSVRRPSVVRPSVASIISEVIVWISFKFSCGFPLAISPDVFFKKNSKKFQKKIF